MIAAIRTMYTWIRVRFDISERGQDLLEYALIGGFVAAAIVIGGVLLAPQVTNMFTEIGQCIDLNSLSVCDAGP